MLDLDAIRRQFRYGCVTCDRTGCVCCDGKGWTESVPPLVAALIAEVERLRGQRQTPGASKVIAMRPLGVPPHSRQRSRAEVLEEQRTVYGCCDRHADNQACDCLERAI
jgi:hypothetical protein